jgi:hypothetical protein
MATDLRSVQNDCENDGDWTPGGNTTDLDSELIYEGSGAIAFQASNSSIAVYTGTLRDGATTGSISLTNGEIVTLLVKDNLIATESLGGIQVVVGDGTNRIGYHVGGVDNIGLVLYGAYVAYRLDLSNVPTSFTTYAGSEASLNTSSITELGYGTIHAVSARGSVNNAFFDVIRASNPATTYDFRIDGGGVGTEIDMDSIYTADFNTANGWGIINRDFGTQYSIQANIEWGHPTLASYFKESGSQLFFKGAGLGTGRHKLRLVGGSGVTNSFELDNCTFVSSGEPAIFDFSDTNHNICKITDTSFINFGAITYPAQSAGNRTLTNVTFSNCGQIDFDGIDATGCKIIGTRSTAGSMLIDSSTNIANQSGFELISDGSSRGIEFNTAGDYTLTNFTFTGFTSTAGNEAFNNTSGGTVNVTLVGGGLGDTGTLSTTGSTVNIIQTRSFTIRNIKPNTELRVYSYTDITDPSTYTEEAGVELAASPPTSSTFDSIVEESDGSITAIYNYDSTAGNIPVRVVAHNTAYNYFSTDITLLASENTSLQLFQISDRNYNDDTPPTS